MKAARVIAAAAIVGAFGLVLAAAAGEPEQCAHGTAATAKVVPEGEKKITDPFRQEHASIQEHLTHMAEMVADLATMPAEEQKPTMKHIVPCMTNHVRHHAEWEELVLYPVVDKYAGVGANGNTFTSTMRHEHKVVGRWIDELNAESEKETPDIRAFSRRADNLLGLIAAHFEQEEEVLLPVLETAMTAEQFQKEIMEKMVAE